MTINEFVGESKIEPVSTLCFLSERLIITSFALVTDMQFVENFKICFFLTASYVASSVR